MSITTLFVGAGLAALVGGGLFDSRMAVSIGLSLAVGGIMMPMIRNDTTEDEIIQSLRRTPDTGQRQSAHTTDPRSASPNEGRSREERSRTESALTENPCYDQDAPSHHHVNVSVERTDYAPVRLDQLLDRAQCAKHH